MKYTLKFTLFTNIVKLSSKGSAAFKLDVIIFLYLKQTKFAINFNRNESKK